MQNFHNPAFVASIVFLAFAASFLAMVAWWALVGWGVSIAMRAYRWGMRRHDERHAADHARPVRAASPVA